MHVVQELLWKQNDERKSLEARMALIEKQIATVDDAVRSVPSISISAAAPLAYRGLRLAFRHR